MSPLQSRWSKAPAYVYLVVAVLLTQSFGGNAELAGFPLPPDRVLLLAAITAFWLHPDRKRIAWQVRPIHVIAMITIGWCLLSMIASGTLYRVSTMFSLWDAFGVWPFLLLFAAPLIFSTPERRDVLLFGIASFGLYLGVTAVLEGLGSHSLIWPKYIVNPDVGLHFGRARGLALTTASNGLSLMAGGMAAALVLSRGSRYSARTRLLALVTTGACAAGMVFTMTRSVWIGGVAGALAGGFARRATRRPTALVALASPLVLALIWIVLPSEVQQSFTDRVGDSRSGFDRVNASVAAVRAVAAHPIGGVGYQNFFTVERDWLWQADDIPVTATGIAVHNVFLGHAVEIGIVGAALWLTLLLLAVASTWPNFSGDPDLRDWRLFALGYVTCWFCIANLAPIAYPQPMAMLWLSLGLVADPRKLGLPPPARAVRPSLAAQ